MDRWSIAEVILGTSIVIQPRTALDVYGRCPQCHARLTPDTTFAEIVVCLSCDYFDINGDKIKPQVLEE